MDSRRARSRKFVGIQTVPSPPRPVRSGRSDLRQVGGEVTALGSKRRSAQADAASYEVVCCSGSLVDAPIPARRASYSLSIGPLRLGKRHNEYPNRSCDHSSAAGAPAGNVALSVACPIGGDVSRRHIAGIALGRIPPWAAVGATCPAFPARSVGIIGTGAVTRITRQTFLDNMLLDLRIGFARMGARDRDKR